MKTKIKQIIKRSFLFDIYQMGLYWYIKILSKTSMKKWYKSKGFSQEFYEDNIKDIEIWATSFKKDNSFFGLRPEDVLFLKEIIDCKIFKLGSLQYGLLKVEENILFLDVHIREKIDLSPEKCRESYDMAFRFFSDLGYQFDKIKFIGGPSWIWDRKISKYLRSYHLAKLQDDYIIVDKGGESYSDILFRIFDIKNVTLDKKDLPENTVVQRSFKKALLNNEKFHYYKVEKNYLCDFEKLKEIEPVWLNNSMNKL